MSATSALLAMHRPLLPLAALLSILAATAYPASARAQDAAAWLERAAKAARSLNYVGTIVFQSGGRAESSRLVHMNDAGGELDKLVNLEGPAREVIRSNGEVRCYYPDSKVVRIEQRVIRNVFPSLSAQQLAALTNYYDFRKAEVSRVAGLEAQAFVFEPRDGLRYGHKFWADRDSGLLLKARLIDEKGEVVEQMMFTDITIGVNLDRERVKPTWGTTPPDWQVRQGLAGEVVAQDTGWTVSKVPPGFTKITEGYRFRPMRGQRDRMAYLVYSDGLVAFSVFIEPLAAVPGQSSGALRQQGALNGYALKLDDHLVTVLGEVPAATVRQIATSVARR